MPDAPNIIIPLCDADWCSVSETAQIGREVFTIAELEEMNERGMTYQTRQKPHTGAEN